MTTGLSYDGSVSGTMSYIAQIAQLAVVHQSDTNYLTILPAMITYAENRMYRDLDFLVTTASNSSIYALTAFNRLMTIPTADFVTLQEINVITPAGTSNPRVGTRNPLLPVTKEFINYMYPTATPAGVPQYFAMFTQNSVIMGPAPDATYSLEVIGTVRPDSMSATNPTTFISLYLPDLFIMASMIYISAFQRNFGNMSANDPQMPGGYEAQYQALLKGATIEEARKKFQSSGWASQSPAPVASPSRG